MKTYIDCGEVRRIGSGRESFVSLNCVRGLNGVVALHG